MQCPSCGFENMPGSDGCARCGTSLKIATMTLDVRPPRASSARGIGRRIWAGRFRLINIGRALQELQAAWEAEGERRFDEDDSPWPLLRRTVVPGWPQRYLGQRWQSHVLFWPFAACMVVGLVNWGLERGQWFLGMAFLIQQLSLIDIFRAHLPGADFWTRIRRTFAGMFALTMAVWFPSLYVLLHLAEPYAFRGNVGPFGPGDMVLVNRWLSPSPGRVVMAYVPFFDRVGGRLMVAGHNVDYGNGSFTSDRVVGTAGDSVEWKDGTLFRNAVAQSWKSLNSQSIPKRASTQIQPGDVGIFLNVNLLPPPMRQDPDLSIAQVPRDDVIGVVWFRWRPLSRLGWIF
jgi:hypothetical protein